MTISSYATLVSALDGTTGWLHRGDLTARIPELIALAEADLQVRCKLVEFEASGTVTITAGVGTLPTDFVAARSVYWVGSPNRPLQYIAPAQYDELRANDSGDGYYYTLSSGDILTTPMGDGSLGLTYAARFTPISGSNATNYLVTNHPGVYLYGTLRQAALWAKDDADAQRHSALLEQAVALVKQDNEERKYAGATLAVRTR